MRIRMGFALSMLCCAVGLQIPEMVVAQDAKLAAAPGAVALKQADERYKADILLVVAHPDDEGAAAAVPGAGD